jgi:hypothetical protein
LGFSAVIFFTVFPLMQVIVVFFGVGVAVVDGVGVGVTLTGGNTGSSLDLLASH